MTLQEIIVRDLRISALIGAHSHELGRRQALVIDARVEMRTVAEDLLSETIDYNAIVRYAETLSDKHITLIETFSARLAARCLEHVGAQAADVTVHKPSALLNGMASARTVLERR